MPIHMRLPKLKGFRNAFRVEYQVVNVAKLAELFPQGGTVSPEALVEAGAVRKGAPVKVLGTGDLGGVKLDVTANAFSASAADKIAAAGGSTTTLLTRRRQPPAAEPARQPCRAGQATVRPPAYRHRLATNRRQLPLGC